MFGLLGFGRRMIEERFMDKWRASKRCVRTNRIVAESRLIVKAITSLRACDVRGRQLELRVHEDDLI
jgi:hypothetical protein